MIIKLSCNSGYSRNNYIMQLIHTLAAEWDSHVPGISNLVSDTISQWHAHSIGQSRLFRDCGQRLYLSHCRSQSDRERSTSSSVRRPGTARTQYQWWGCQVSWHPSSTGPFIVSHQDAPRSREAGTDLTRRGRP